MSEDGLGAGSLSEGSVHVHFAKKVHAHQSPVTPHRSDHNPEIYCVTSDGRLMIFKLESNTTNGVGDFARFTRKLEVWIPLRCENCGLTQLMDMGVAYVDESDVDERTIDSGKSRIYGGRFACPSCTSSIRIVLKFEYYASAGRFTREASDGGRIIHLAGLRDFFKSAKTASTPGHHSEAHDKQGSLMHFG
jgi:hypothetical protein